MIPRGGTELMMANLHKFLGGWPRNINLIASDCSWHKLDLKRPNVVWQHLDVDQEASQGAAQASFQQHVTKWVFVSEWQRTRWIQYFGIDPSKTCVIRNAIESLPAQTKPQPTPYVQLIYTSTPWRGLDVLLRALNKVRHSNWQLTVYSSTIIYGKAFSDSTQSNYQHLFDYCRQHPRIRYVGYGINQAVRRKVQHSHIWAYPSTFPETSCVAAIEAAAAGCSVVTTDLGALPETLGSHATYVSHIADRDQLVNDFALALDKAISDYHYQDSKWEQQAREIDKLYCWSTRIQEWKTLLDQLPGG